MQIQTETLTQPSPLAGTAVRIPQAPLGTCSGVLQRFSPTSLSEMQAVSLLRRTDTKYVMRTAQLIQALAALTQEYAVLEINGRRQHQYQTLYFDTPDFALYQQHHNGQTNRYKVRSRCYVDSQRTFLEVKQKTNKAVTIKSRLQTPSLTTRADANTDSFLKAHYPYEAAGLEPKLWNYYTRITLVSKHTIERVTLDLGLRFAWGDTRIALPGIAVAELKQAHFSLRSEFAGQMRALNLRSMGFSKYCTGVALLYDSVKHNNFKPKLRYVTKLMQNQEGSWAI